ncbi:uncharacterized protein LOC118505766 [Anopheles stephensi]|uniref:uncharacterized protein LOC118505766 n=1 Tax=Anopheles stephensi TaxID=30069 RepID=UPI001658C0D7|nr:uncharacterized protein LOC118505766 [Anopheles stephensi]XP_035897898.1 uncharacterized protein LOC118505766 [Anopheles stephensi]XP_035897899.1 uncharacterized protein LOC118505766 [Anopheles stephensi]XP_035897900.1 uncharacterized protein LOC118505766 [Anopheles stephensi]XP_035897901.1 uncharacterized protein LOC118505766 [Anopheles stephensi]XP_035897902.1 uncharacterized protein LOC118505766 [Anopheles stephensi]
MLSSSAVHQPSGHDRAVQFAKMIQLQRTLVTDCVQFLKTIRSYLRECEGPCREVEDGPVPDAEQNGYQTYLNVLQNQQPDGVRDRLIVQCEALVERFEKSVNAVSLLKENDVKGTEETREELEYEEENSYLDMSGSRSTLKPNSSSSNVSIIEAREEFAAQHDESFDEEMLFDTPQENSYDLTTDQILYDECLQEVSYEQEPSPTTAQRAPTPENALHESQCPFGGLPASHLRLQQSPKHGTLFKQEKRLFFDQFKKYYVGLIGKWLLVYNSHNDLKPWQTIFIKSIKLDLNLNEQINEKHLFQIITHTDSKVHFLSPSFQDLNEWIVAIENNLIEKVERPPVEECAGLQMPRKLPLPPCPVARSERDETDLHATGQHVEDGIYEEPSLCLKTESDQRAKAHGYDTPKPCCVSSNANTCNSPHNNKKPDLPTVKPTDTCGPSTPTPVKSWLKNRFNRSPPDSTDTKASKKALKKLSFEELSVPEAGCSSSSSAKQMAIPAAPSSPKFSLSTTPSSKGTKINMIISQLEANGQLNLLSKRLNDPGKRYTWVADGVTS